jgi:hypothetical protein
MSYKLRKNNNSSETSTISGNNPLKNIGGRKMQNLYENKDFYLSAFLMASGLELVEHRRVGPITIFGFKQNEKLMNLVDQYYAVKGSVKPMIYGTYIRNLKSILHNAVSESNSEVNYVKQNKKGKYFSRG